MTTIKITVQTGRTRGLFDITPECTRFVAACEDGNHDGLLVVFVPHRAQAGGDQRRLLPTVTSARRAVRWRLSVRGAAR